MKHIFGFQRSLLKAARPVLNRLSPVELPPDSYFRSVQDLFQKVEGIDGALEDPQLTSVRLVTNAEKMVLRETQRAFVYFTLHGLTVDHIIVNRLLPESIQDSFFSSWREAQGKTLDEIIHYFEPVPTKTAPLFEQEVLGYDRLKLMAQQLYPDNEDPSLVTRDTPPFSFLKLEDHWEVRLTMPFAAKGEVALFKKHDELIIEVGTIRRHIGLPTTMINLMPVKARLIERMLVVDMKESA
jgi:arsenite-transporting ATPase